MPPLALTTISLFSIQPLARRQMLCSDDGIFHIHKALGLELLIQRGYWFPRWSPEMAHGFGYPLYNFYAPLGSYVLAGLHALGFSYPAALHLGLGLSIWLSGLAVYGLVRRWWGASAALAAGVVYCTAPYLAFDALFRGAFAETLAWVWLPLVLWAAGSAIAGGRPARDAAVAATAYAALLLTHNAIALVSTPLIASYAILEAVRLQSWRRLAAGLGILAAGAGLSAYFWIPALGEQALVQTDRLLVPPIFTYYTNYLTPAELLALPRSTDPLLINPSPPKALGLVSTLMALAGTAALLRPAVRRSEHGVRIALFALALLGYGWLTMPLSRAAWEHLPLLPFVQFPWRMLMPAALCASVLAGAAVQGWTLPYSGTRPLDADTRARPARHQPRAAWVALAFVVAAVVGHLSWWYPRYCAPFVEETVARMLQYEWDSATVGTSAKAEFLPRTVKSVPDDRSVAQALQRGEQPDRLRGLPDGATVEVLSADPLRYRFHVDTPSSFDLTYLMFDYAGWTAEVDGELAPVMPTSEQGLISFRVPAGSHLVTVRFGATPLRTAAGALSVVTGLGLAALLALGLMRPALRPLARGSNAPRPPTTTSPPPSTNRYAAAFCLLALFLLAAKLTWVDRTSNPLRQSSYHDGRLGFGAPVDQSVAGGLRILSSEAPATVPSGESFDIALYVAAAEPPAGNFRPKFTLVNGDGVAWNDPTDALPPRWHREPPPTFEWEAGHYAQWARYDLVLPGTPPGTYRLYGEVFDTQSLLPLSVLDANGNLTAPQFDLGPVAVTRPVEPADADGLNIQYPSGALFGIGLRLLGYNLDRVEARPGDTMLVTLFWRAVNAPGRDVVAFLALEDGGEVLFETQFSPASEQFPTSRWQAGDVWRGQHVVRLPPDLPDGEFAWRLSVDEERAALGPLAVTAPERVFAAPDFEVQSGARLGEFAELVGYNLSTAPPRPGAQVSVTLVWRALASPSVSYLAFIHLMDASGRVWAQSDTIPAGWTRPTTGWLPGEYVVDSHTLSLSADVPPGEYTLAVGMADAQTGLRANGIGPGALDDGRVSIDTLVVAP